MENVARIVLGLEEHDVAEEVMHFLDRTGHTRVVATAGDQRQLAEAIRQTEPDAIVATPTLMRPGIINGSALLAVDTRESVGSLRAAIRAGADGYYLWPGDRDELAGAAARVLAPTPEVGGQRARVVAVYGPRGGAGATFLASHLAAAFARREHRCVLIDMDPLFGDVSAAIGVPADDEVRTIFDVLPLVDELTPEHLDGVLWSHREGFRTLLAPEPQDAGRVDARAYRAAIDTAAAAADVITLHLGRALDDVARCGLEAADRVLIVLTLDVFSFRDAKRALAVIGELGLEERCEFVVNRASRAEISASDVRRVFGRVPAAVISTDRGVASAQDRGRLLPRRGRTARAVDRLAARLMEGER